VAESQLGVGLAQVVFKKWGWLFRDQPIEDYGIDCQAEPKGELYATGRLIGLQLKTGRQKYFRKPAQNGGGWYFGPDAKKGQRPDKHLRYWLEHSLPVVVILVDDVNDKLYWQHVTLERVIFTGRSWKILVPASQPLDASAHEAFERLALQTHTADPSVLATASRHLPPDTGRILRDAGECDHFMALQLAVTLSRGRETPEATVSALLADPERYLHGAGGRLSAAAAVFAADHGFPLLAAQAYSLAATMAGDKAGRHHAFAAWTLAGAGEFTAAHASLVKAVAAGAPDLLCTWIRCVIEHEGPGFPTGTAELRQASVEQIDIEPFYRIFLAHSAHAASDLSEAMRYLEEALEASPHSSMLQVALARVLLARVAASMSHVPTLDLRRAMELLHCHIMASDFDTAQRLATAWPAGDALAREAACGLVAFLGVRVALSLGDTVGAEVIADSVGVG